MIRVLHFTTDSRISGAEKLLITLANNFDESQFELMFCTIKPRGALHDELDAAGKKTFSLNYTAFVDFIPALLRLRRIICTHKIEILHTHLFHASFLGHLSIVGLRKTKGLITKHYSDLLYVFGRRMETYLDRWSLRRTQHVIAISESVKNALVAYDKVPPNKIAVVRNGLAVTQRVLGIQERELLKKQLGITNTCKVIGAFGNLHICKGHRYLIETADILRNRRSDLLFLIAGDGQLTKELYYLREAFDLSRHVLFTGYRKDIDRIIALMDIVVQPSLKEGLGLSIVEAMGQRKPVIGSNVDGIPEIIEDGVTGLLVPPKQPRALADAIEYLLSDERKMHSLGERGQQRVRSEFSVHSMVRGYQQIYHQVLGKASK